MKRFIILILITIIVSGCGVIRVNRTSTPKTVVPIGIYKSANAGETWESKSNIYSTKGEVRTFTDSNITTLIQDPNDPMTLYAGTNSKGLVYTYNGAEGWQSTLTNKGVVNAIAVDTSDKCVVYAALYNTIFKTIDCNRTWNQVHFSTLDKEFFTTLAIDPARSNVVFAGTSRGTLLVSRDAGISWQVSVFFPSQLSQLLIQPDNANIMYLATVSRGLYYSDNGGSTWSETSKLDAVIIDRKLTQGTVVATTTGQFGNLKNANTFRSMSLDSTQPNSLLYSNNYGIFRFTGGSSWREIQILNKPAEEIVYAIAVNPQNPQMLALTTTGAYYLTDDGGANWSVKVLPAAGIPRFLIINPKQPKEVYIGFYQTAK